MNNPDPKDQQHRTELDEEEALAEQLAKEAHNFMPPEIAA